MKNHSLHTIYCDDIRQESGGKHSLMGCYGPELIVDSSIPILLPKLCARASLVFAVNGTLPPSVKFRATLYNEVIAELDAVVPTPADSSTKWVMIGAHFQFAPFALNAEDGVFCITAHLDDETIDGPALRLIARIPIDAAAQVLLS